MSSTDRRTDGRTDRRTDGQTDGQGESSIPPSNFVGRGYNNSMWQTVAVWWHISEPILAQVVACCLMAPRYHLNQCWLLINRVSQAWEQLHKMYSSIMMTSSNGNIFHVTGPLCREFTGPQWIPHTKASDVFFDVFFDLRLNKRFGKQSWGWWFETLPHPLWRHSNVQSFTLLNLLPYLPRTNESSRIWNCKG